LYRIGKAETAACPFCDLDDDSADHTLQSCPAWREERTQLIYTIGPDLSLSGVLSAMVSNRDSWIAFARFAEIVMSAKEDAERIREAARLSPDSIDPG